MGARERIRRLPPCPAYDAAGMERWLTDMAAKGWLLEKDGFSFGLAAFEKGEPQAARYRLTASLKGTGLFDANAGDPETEEPDPVEEYGWEYLGSRGEFYIYRACREDARELHTDPEVQAVSIRAVRRRRLGAGLSALIWLAVTALGVFFRQGGPVLTAVELGFWTCALILGVAVWMLIRWTLEARWLRRLEDRLRHAAPEEKLPARGRAYFIRQGVSWAALALLLGVLLGRAGGALGGGDRTTLTQYTGRPPFATLADFAGQRVTGYQLDGYGLGLNYVQTWKDPLAPESVRWRERARVTRADGTVLDGGLDVDYHRAATKWLAGRLARGYAARDRRDKYYRPLEVTVMGADYALVYDHIFLTVVLQKGNVVIHATFFQTGAENAVPTREWVAVLLESLSTP